MAKKNQKYKISQAVKFIWTYVKKYKSVFFLTLFLSLLSSAIQAIYPSFFGQIIDSFLNKTLIMGLSLQTILAIWIGLVLFRVINERIKARLAVWLECQIEKDLTEDLVAQILAVPISYHYDQKPGTVYKKIDRAVNATNSIVDSFVFSFLDNTLTIVFVLILMLSINWILALINFIAIFSFLLFAIIYRMNKILGLRKKVNKKFNAIFGNIGDFISNIFTVKTNTSEKFEINRVHKEYGKANEIVTQQMKLWTEVSMGQSLIHHGGIILTVVFGSWFLNKQIITTGQFVSFLVYLSMIYGPLWWMTNQYRSIKRMIIDIADAKNILNLAKEKSFSKEEKQIEVNGGIEFKNVSFKYSERNQGILDKVSFKIKPGETLAIFGETGSGKTTLYNLLLRLYDQDEGQILFDGIDSQEIERYFLRSQMAVVPQDPSLFNESILFNIKYGNPKASFEDVEAAARIANADGFIKSLPKGYNTKVGERGVKLSGGQVQRIAIARAAIRQPKILILDEATTSLDQKTKFAVLDALQNLIKDRTTIIITHDFSAITQSADQIIVLDKGKIVQQGKHHKLVSQRGIYRDLWQTHQKHLQIEK